LVDKLLWGIPVFCIAATGFVGYGLTDITFISGNLQDTALADVGFWHWFPMLVAAGVVFWTWLVFIFSIGFVSYEVVQTIKGRR
jgi:hypothetical protein